MTDRGRAVLQAPTTTNNALEGVPGDKRGPGDRLNADGRRWYKQPTQRSHQRATRTDEEEEEEEVDVVDEGDDVLSSAVQEIEQHLAADRQEPEATFLAGAATAAAAAAATPTAEGAVEGVEVVAVDVEPKVVAVTGTVTIVHSIKSKTFRVTWPPGLVAVAEIDDRFCFPFAFTPGKYTCLLYTSPSPRDRG